MRSNTVSLASDYVHDLSVRQKRTPPRTEIDVRMMSRDEHERGYADQGNHKAMEEAISREDRHRARSSSFNSAGGGHPPSFPASGTLPISRSQYTTPPPSSSPMPFLSPSGGVPITSSDYTPPATATANARLLRNFGPRPIQFSSNSTPSTSGSGALGHPMSASAALSRGRGLTRPPSSSGSAASSTGTAIASGLPGVRPSTADSQTLVSAGAVSGRPHPLSRLPSLHSRPVSSSGAGPAPQPQSGAPPSSFRFDAARDTYVESRSQSSNSPPTPSKRRWSGYDYNEQHSMMVDELAEDEDTKPGIRSSLMRRRSLDERERSSSGTVRRHSHQHSHQQHSYPYPHPAQSSSHHHSHSRSSRPQSSSSSEHDGSRDPIRHGAREQRHSTNSTVSPTQSMSSHLALSPATEPPNPYERLYPPARNDRDEYQHRHADHPYQSFQHPDARHSRGPPPPITTSSVMGQKRSHEEMRSSSHSNSPTDPEQERYAHHHSSVRLRPIVPGSNTGVRVKDEPEY